MRTSTRTTALTGTALLLLSFALTGCSTPPWAAAAPDASPTPTSSEIAPLAPNDLSSGSTERVLTTGPLTVSVDYWSTLTMDKWTADPLKPVSLSMITAITPNDGQKVYLQRATMVATPMSATETFDPLSGQVDSATTTPGYLVLDPYSYSQTFTVGTTPAKATYVSLEFTYEFLVQATPTSSDYAKQTATDTITVAIRK